MKNSRKDGTLVVKCNKPYIMSVDGQPVESHIILCKDINHEAEYIAMDLEQMLRASVLNMPQQEGVEQQSGDNEDEKKAEKYYEDECPSVADVEENANVIEMIAGMNTKIKVSELMKTFVGLVKCRLVVMENKLPMPYAVWDSLSLEDKLKIMYCYISFFVNPLQKLVSLSSKMASSRDLQGQTQKTEMQSESPLYQKEA